MSPRSGLGLSGGVGGLGGPGLALVAVAALGLGSFGLALGFGIYAGFMLHVI